MHVGTGKTHTMEGDIRSANGKGERINHTSFFICSFIFWHISFLVLHFCWFISLLPERFFPFSRLKSSLSMNSSFLCRFLLLLNLYFTSWHHLLGIIPRVVEALFDAVSEADESIEFTFKVTYVEIYMEKIRDLLDETRVKVSIVYSSFLYSSYSFFWHNYHYYRQNSTDSLFCESLSYHVFIFNLNLVTLWISWPFAVTMKYSYISTFSQLQGKSNNKRR